MPLSDAERQRLYRERLKMNHPDKYLLQNIKNAERARMKRKKISEYSPTEQEIIRKQWRERKKKSKEVETKVEKSRSRTQTVNQERSVIYKLRKENKELKLQQEILKKLSRNLRKRLKRSDDKCNGLLKLIKIKDEMIMDLQEKLNSSPTIIIVQKEDE